MAIGKWCMYLSAVLFLLIGFGPITSDEIGGVKTTAWILAATFIPTALLFAWCGRWFKSMEGSVPTSGR